MIFSGFPWFFMVFSWVFHRFSMVFPCFPNVFDGFSVFCMVFHHGFGQEVDSEDIFNALERIAIGLEKKDAVMSEQKRKLVAYHEAGEDPLNVFFFFFNIYIYIRCF